MTIIEFQYAAEAFCHAQGLTSNLLDVVVWWRGNFNYDDWQRSQTEHPEHALSVYSIFSSSIVSLINCKTAFRKLP